MATLRLYGLLSGFAALKPSDDAGDVTLTLPAKTGELMVGARGAGSDKVFWENDTAVTTSYTITSDQNAMSAGPVEIEVGATVTIPVGSEWSIV